MDEFSDDGDDDEEDNGETQEEITAIENGNMSDMTLENDPSDEENILVVTV